MLAPSTILVVEDNPVEREALMRVLRLADYDAVGAETPEEALTHLDEPIDLVLSDLRMGEVGGLELLQHWKERRPETPFILVTAYGDIASAVEAMKRGAADYLTKPVHPGSLLNLIEKWVETSRAGTNGHAAPPAGESFGYAATHTPEIAIPPDTSLEDLERVAVEKALEQHNGNRTHAARTLGISVRTLQRKLKAWRSPTLSLQNRLRQHELCPQVS